MTRVLLLILTLLSASGCAALQQPAQPYVQPPKLNSVTVVVLWASPEVIKARCGQGAAACSTVGRFDGDTAFILAPMPTSFSDDERLRLLGHELLHALGAMH